MNFEALTPFGRVVVVLGVFWGTCSLIALSLFLISDTLNNLTHGSGWFGLYHTISRVPLLLLISPVYLAGFSLSLIRRASGADRAAQEPTDSPVDLPPLAPRKS